MKKGKKIKELEEWLNNSKDTEFNDSSDNVIKDYEEVTLDSDFEYILTIDNPSVINKGDTILSNITSTSGTIVSTDKANSTVKVKVSNVFPLIPRDLSACWASITF